MAYYPTEPDADDARQLLDNALLSDDEQCALERILAAFEADEGCEDEAGDILNDLRETDMPNLASLDAARSLPLGGETTVRSSSATYMIRHAGDGIQWTRQLAD